MQPTETVVEYELADGRVGENAHVDDVVAPFLRVCPMMASVLLANNRNVVNRLMAVVASTAAPLLAAVVQHLMRIVMRIVDRDMAVRMPLFRLQCGTVDV